MGQGVLRGTGFAELQASVTCPQPFLWSASRIQICISKQINIPYIYSPSHALPETWVYLGNYENVRAPTLLTLLGLQKPDLFQIITSHTMLICPLQICYNICTKTKSGHLQQSLSCSGLLFSDLVIRKVSLAAISSNSTHSPETSRKLQKDPNPFTFMLSIQITCREKQSRGDVLNHWVQTSAVDGHLINRQFINFNLKNSFSLSSLLCHRWCQTSLLWGVETFFEFQLMPILLFSSNNSLFRWIYRQKQSHFILLS